MSLWPYIEIQFVDARAGADRLEAIRVREDPVRPVTAGAPAEHAHLRAVDDALRDQRVHARHDVVDSPSEVVARRLDLVLLAVVRRAAVVGHEHRVARAGVDCAP